MELWFDVAPALRRLLLEHPERGEAASRGEHGLDALDAERADQLTLEVGHADVRLGEHAPEEMRLALVAEAADGRAGLESRDEAPDRVRAADRHDRDSLSCEIATEASGE